MHPKFGGFIIAALSSLPLTAQHDPGRNAVRLLAEGNVEGALKTIETPAKRMNSPVDEAEMEFVKAMVACHQNKLDEATAFAKKALENGLQSERLMAGPRDLLKPLQQHKPFQELLVWGPDKKSNISYRAVGNPDGAFNNAMKQMKHRLLHAPMLGSVTDTSASFWIRTAGETDVQIKVLPVGEKGQELIGTAKTSADRDYTAVVRVEGLKPGTEYQYKYKVSADGLESMGLLLTTKEGKRIFINQRFRTFPKAGSPSSFTIAFGGGAGYTPQYERMWTTIAKRDPLALLLLGDNVYIDDPEHQLTQDYCYYRRQSVPEWKALVAKTPVAAIYDDHDFGINDCVPGPEIDQPSWKRSVWETFRNNWVNPAYGGGDKQPGCWFDFMIGQVHFIMLDCRYYRDLKGGSMLGPVQKAWALDKLKASPGVFKVLVSSVPWSPGVKPGSKDTWDGFADEREEIFSFIEKQKINGVLLMAADRHRSDFRKIPRPQGYDLYEMMSSRLTNVHTHGLAKGALGSEFIMGYNAQCSFGLVEFDTTLKDPQFTYTIVNIDNEEVGTASLKLSELAFEK